MSDWVLTAQNLTCERDDRILFENLSFQISSDSGQIVRVLGPNGAGKSTLLRILIGLGAYHEGEVLFNQHPIEFDRESYHQHFLYLGHEAGIKRALTPEENLRWLLEGRESEAKEPNSDTELTDRIWQALAQVGLGGYEDVLCASLSAGQQRRVALARLYLDPAPIWILDEPFTAIDSQGVEQLEQLIATHKEKGGSVLLTTHHNLSIPHAKLDLVSGQLTEGER